VNLVDVLDQLWNRVLEIISIFVLPDWGSFIGLLPVFVLIGLIGPFITLTVLGSIVYLARKPRVKVAFEEGPRVAELGPGGESVYPVGLPHCRRDALVYPSGTLRCERCGDELAVVCPMCTLGRSALADTCSNCGLVLKVRPRAIAVRATASPKAGGAAAA